MRYLYIKNVMTLRTPEKLKAMFQQSRARKQKEKEQHKQDRQQQYQLLCKKVNKVLQDEKKQKMEQLYQLAEKCRQKAPKCTVTELYISDNRYIERDNDWMHLYKTREELKQAEERGEGKINWTVWDRLITEFRKQLGL